MASPVAPGVGSSSSVSTIQRWWKRGTPTSYVLRMDTAISFLAIAALLSLTPGATTALVVRSALRGGRREALATTAGNEAGVLQAILRARRGEAPETTTAAAE